MKFWFYVETPGVIPRTEPKVKKFPFASTMTEMKPCCQVRPPTSVDAERAACDAAFAKACCYSGGHDIVEEMVLS